MDWVAKVGQGNYDLTIRGAVYGATPYFVMRSLLSGKLYQPVGTIIPMPAPARDAVMAFSMNSV